MKNAAALGGAAALGWSVGLFRKELQLDTLGHLRDRMGMLKIPLVQIHSMLAEKGGLLSVAVLPPTV